MGIECQILLDIPSKGIHKSGDPVTGRLVYNTNKSKIFKSIFIHLSGTGSCSWSEGTGNNRRSYSNSERYLSMKKIVIGSENVVEAGVYEHPFQFFLPVNLPSSFKNDICTISYIVEAVFIIPGSFGQKQKQFATEITFYGDLNPLYAQPLIYGLSKSLFSLKSQGPVELKIEIERTFLMPGENIKLRGFLRNHSNTSVKCIKIKLNNVKTYIASGGHKRVDKSQTEESATYVSEAEEQSEILFTCIVPTMPNLYSIQHSEIFKQEYELKVEVMLPYFRINPFIEIPVVIGEQSEQYEDQPSNLQTHDEENTDSVFEKKSIILEKDVEDFLMNELLEESNLEKKDNDYCKGSTYEEKQSNSQTREKRDGRFKQKFRTLQKILGNKLNRPEEAKHFTEFELDKNSKSSGKYEENDYSNGVYDDKPRSDEKHEKDYTDK